MIFLNLLIFLGKQFLLVIITLNTYWIIFEVAIQVTIKHFTEKRSI